MQLHKRILPIIPPANVLNGFLLFLHVFFTGSVWLLMKYGVLFREWAQVYIRNRLIRTLSAIVHSRESCSLQSHLRVTDFVYPNFKVRFVESNFKEFNFSLSLREVWLTLWSGIVHGARQNQRFK